MILVDTSVWIDHLRASNATLVDLLESAEVATHPLVIGELAVGSIRRRADFLDLLGQLPSMPVANSAEVLTFIDARTLYGQGLGIVDVHLLASATLLPGSTIWTRDSRLLSAATALGLASSS